MFFGKKTTLSVNNKRKEKGREKGAQNAISSSQLSSISFNTPQLNSTQLNSTLLTNRL
jgi:hypothetical protein